MLCATSVKESAQRIPSLSCKKIPLTFKKFVHKQFLLVRRLSQSPLLLVIEAFASHVLIDPGDLSTANCWSIGQEPVAAEKRWNAVRRKFGHFESPQRNSDFE
jgi:hypothetical protein